MLLAMEEMYVMSSQVHCKYSRVRYLVCHVGTKAEPLTFHVCLRVLMCPCVSLHANVVIFSRMYREVRKLIEMVVSSCHLALETPVAIAPSHTMEATASVVGAAAPIAVEAATSRVEPLNQEEALRLRQLVRKHPGDNLYGYLMAL